MCHMTQEVVSPCWSLIWCQCWQCPNSCPQSLAHLQRWEIDTQRKGERGRRRITDRERDVLALLSVSIKYTELYSTLREGGTEREKERTRETDMKEKEWIQNTVRNHKKENESSVIQNASRQKKEARLRNVLLNTSHQWQQQVSHAASHI